MSRYSVAEAKNNLPKLLDRMLAGEEVKITRRGKTIARLEPASETSSQPPIDIAWLRKVRITAGGPNSVDLVRQVRED